MPAKDPLLFVIHIRDCCERILQYTAGLSSKAMYEQMVLDAVCRNLQIIGEAARKVDDQFRQDHPEIPWSSTIGLRNVIVHAYDGVLPEVIQ